MVQWGLPTEAPMELTSDPTLLDYLLRLPLKVVGLLAVGAIILRSIQWCFEYFAARAAQNPEEALRNDLMKAHQEVRKEVQELRSELSEAYDKMRKLSVELNKMRENLAAFRYELHLLKTEFPQAEHVISLALKKLENIDVNDLSE